MLLNRQISPAGVSASRGVPILLILFVLTLCITEPGLHLHAQERAFLETRFFSSSITLNTRPDLAEVIYENTQGHLVVQGSPLVDVISKAYGMPDYQIVDGPQWIYEPYIYDIVAVPPPAFVDSDQQQMLQGLLADKFHLEANVRSREVSIWWVVEEGSGGTKLQPVTDAGWEGILLGNNLMGAGPGKIRARIGMEVFARYLGDILGGPVLNHTKLSGRYEINLEGVDANDPESFVEPMQQQLGLQFSEKSIAMDVLVISHVARPELDQE